MGTPVGLVAANSSTLLTAFQQAGAFPWPAGSRDAALLIDVPAGAYTLQVRGADEGIGVALVEVYEVPALTAVVNASLPAELRIQSFTFTSEYSSRRRGYIYRPLIRAVEMSGNSAVTITMLAFHLEGIAPGGRVPPWHVTKQVAAGGVIDLIDPNVYGSHEIEIESDSDAASMTVTISYRDNENRAYSVSGTAQTR